MIDWIAENDEYLQNITSQFPTAHTQKRIEDRTVPLSYVPLTYVRNLQRGDILLFTTHAETLDVSHVAIMTGPDTLIHAAQAGKVQGEQLHDYLARRSQFTGAIILRPR